MLNRIPDAVLRDVNARPDPWIFFRSRTGCFHELSQSTGILILRNASKTNLDRVIICPVDQPDVIASVSRRSLKPYRR